jgi:hypothetical protein
MDDPITLNFKHMLQYICKVASTHTTCPMSSEILSFILSWIFDDEKRVSKIVSKYKESRDALNTKYMNTTDSKYSTYKDALKHRDRSLFNHIELFPSDMAAKYAQYIEWFSNFLSHDMEEKRMEYVWRYLAKIDEQAR